jgi:AcrR family transcriptional regulator
MRYSAEHKQKTRNRIVRAAARQFCRPEGKGSAIADLMRELGLTHGGFYKHFDSKRSYSQRPSLANHIDRYLMDPTSFSGLK